MRRTLLSAEFLQWAGLGGAAATWAAQHVFGFGATVARCGRETTGFGVDLRLWELVAFGVALGLALTAEAAAIVVLLRTRSGGYSAPPPDGRRFFFAAGAAVGNLLFITAILMTGLSTLAFDPCRQA